MYINEPQKQSLAYYKYKGKRRGVDVKSEEYLALNTIEDKISWLKAHTPNKRMGRPPKIMCANCIKNHGTTIDVDIRRPEADTSIADQTRTVDRVDDTPIPEQDIYQQTP